ncbi:uncharacterized protein [Coffea arabica]|uniref:Uncharacterized protein isoform X1 n=1 Tax=Coffea arabica TaxID=13443 RepID=A0ABM4URT0_COFAR
MERSKENKFYARFKEGQSCGCFYELIDILEGRSATGKHAQSSAQSDVHHSPSSIKKTTAIASRRKGKAKVDGPTLDFWREDVYTPVRDEKVEFVASRPSKHPVSSRGISSYDGSRSTKSQKIGEALRDPETNIGKLSQIKIEENTRQNEWCIEALKVWDKCYPKHEPVELWSRKQLAYMKEFENSERWCHMFLQLDEGFQY